MLGSSVPLLDGLARVKANCRTLIFRLDRGRRGERAEEWRRQKAPLSAITAGPPYSTAEYTYDDVGAIHIPWKKS